MTLKDCDLKRLMPQWMTEDDFDSALATAVSAIIKKINSYSDAYYDPSSFTEDYCDMMAIEYNLPWYQAKHAGKNSMIITAIDDYRKACSIGFLTDLLTDIYGYAEVEKSEEDDEVKLQISLPDYMGLYNSGIIATDFFFISEMDENYPVDYTQRDYLVKNDDAYENVRSSFPDYSDVDFSNAGCRAWGRIFKLSNVSFSFYTSMVGNRKTIEVEEGSDSVVYDAMPARFDDITAYFDDNQDMTITITGPEDYFKADTLVLSVPDTDHTWLKASLSDGVFTASDGTTSDIPNLEDFKNLHTYLDKFTISVDSGSISATYMIFGGTMNGIFGKSKFGSAQFYKEEE